METPKEIQALKIASENLPTVYRDVILPLVLLAEEKATARKNILLMIQEALGEIRNQVKYLQFDLEATRRERDEARAKLGEL